MRLEYDLIGGNFPRGGFEIRCRIYKDGAECTMIKFRCKDKKQKDTIDIGSAIVSCNNSVFNDELWQIIPIPHLRRHIAYLTSDEKRDDLAQKIEEIVINFAEKAEF